MLRAYYQGKPPVDGTSRAGTCCSAAHTSGVLTSTGRALGCTSSFWKRVDVFWSSELQKMPVCVCSGFAALGRKWLQAMCSAHCCASNQLLLLLLAAADPTPRQLQHLFSVIHRKLEKYHDMANLPPSFSGVAGGAATHTWLLLFKLPDRAISV